MMHHRCNLQLQGVRGSRVYAMNLKFLGFLPSRNSNDKRLTWGPWWSGLWALLTRFFVVVVFTCELGVAAFLWVEELEIGWDGGGYSEWQDTVLFFVFFLFFFFFFWVLSSLPCFFFWVIAHWFAALRAMAGGWNPSGLHPPTRIEVSHQQKRQRADPLGGQIKSQLRR